MYESKLQVKTADDPQSKFNDFNAEEDPSSPQLKDEKPLASWEPKDEGNIVYYSFLFYGVTILLPWSAILNCFDYFALEVSLQRANPFLDARR